MIILQADDTVLSEAFGYEKLFSAGETYLEPSGTQFPSTTSSVIFFMQILMKRIWGYYYQAMGDPVKRGSKLLSIFFHIADSHADYLYLTKLIFSILKTSQQKQQPFKSAIQNIERLVSSYFYNRRA